MMKKLVNKQNYGFVCNRVRFTIRDNFVNNMIFRVTRRSIFMNNKSSLVNRNQEIGFYARNKGIKGKELVFFDKRSFNRQSDVKKNIVVDLTSNKGNNKENEYFEISEKSAVNKYYGLLPLLIIFSPSVENILIFQSLSLLGIIGSQNFTYDYYAYIFTDSGGNKRKNMFFVFVYFSILFISSVFSLLIASFNFTTEKPATQIPEYSVIFNSILILFNLNIIKYIQLFPNNGLLHPNIILKLSIFAFGSILYALWRLHKNKLKNSDISKNEKNSGIYDIIENSIYTENRRKLASSIIQNEFRIITNDNRFS